jgi:hypothetical protein
MTPAVKLQADLLEHFKGQTFTPGDPFAELLARTHELLTELDERQSGPQFIAIPRLKLGREE